MKTILELFEELKNDEEILKILFKHNLIQKSFVCVICNIPNKIGLLRRRKIFKYIWRCPTCKKVTSLFNGSFFSNAHLSPRTIIFIIFELCFLTPINKISKKAGISITTISDIYKIIKVPISNFLNTKTY